MTMSRWTHAICDTCYVAESTRDETLPEAPVRMTTPVVEDCCFCGEPNISGVYIRRDPKSVKCGGAHEKQDIS